MRERDDVIIPFQVGDGAVRGRIVRLGASIDEILAAHRFSDAASELLGEAAALTALMGASLKFDGKLIFQAHGDGDIKLLVADYVSDGSMRATASIAGEAQTRGLASLMGKGHLALTIDQGPDMDRYQGVTPIEGKTLEEAAVAYFDQSEQIPTAVRLAVGKVVRPGEAAVWRAGGVIVQFMPGEGGARERGEAALKSAEDQEAWDRAAALLYTTQADELIDPALAPEELLYRLYHEDGVRVFSEQAVRAACSCNSGKIEAVLSRYGAEDLADLAEEGLIKVSCEFCRRDYYFDAEGREAKQ
ncbi:MAG: Hsp33 family molecular chaperone [Pseudomonadota bacterium]